MGPQHTLIIGAGRIGRALADLIQHGSSSTHVSLWDKNPQLVPGQLPLETLVATADFIFCCTPSWTVRDVLTDLKPFLKPTCPVITLAKGCEAATGKTMAEVAQDIIGDQLHGVLGGPMLAETLLSGHRGVAVIGSIGPEVGVVIAPLFAGTPVEIELSQDIQGVSLCGCLKNVYAFLVGISTGLDWTTSEQRAFFELARQEFLACGSALGISKMTLQGPAGLGDFIETATSPASHNVQSGKQFAQHGYLTSTSEATITLPSILRRLPDYSSLRLLALLPILLAGQRPVATLRQELHV